jgi:polysaccharide biosynthesis/export protein
VHSVNSSKLQFTLSATGLTLLTLIVNASPTLSAGLKFAQSTAFPPQASATLVDETYTLGGGDVVQLDIFDAPEYSGQNGRYQVLVDGTLNLPLVGSVSVKGLSVKQAGNLLSQKYYRFFKRPLTTVTLLTPRPLTVNIAGEVNRPGSYVVSLGQQNSNSNGNIQFPTLTAALKQAGGITQAADVRQVQIRRSQRNAADQTITVDLWQFLKTGDRQQDITLRDGDSIFLPTASTINLAEATQLADANFSADKGQPINVAVVGEVYRPGSYIVTGTNSRTGTAGVPGGVEGTGELVTDRFPTVTRAIQIAGGIKPLADIRRIQIRRVTRSGTPQTVDVDLLKLVKEGDLQQDAILQAGDTIMIPLATDLTPAETSEIASASFSPDTIRINVVGEVQQPGVVQVPPNTPLNQALLAAGGFNNRRARRSSVELIRLNPNGTVVKRDIAINFEQGVNEQTNPPLRNNDTVVVKRSGLTTFTDNIGNVLTPFSGVLNFLRIFGL